MPMSRLSKPGCKNAPYPKVRILLSDSGRGLQIDADLLEKALVDMGCQVERSVMRPWSIRRTVNSHRYARIKSMLPKKVACGLDRLQVRWHSLGKRQVDLQIHLESLAVDYLAAGRVNWLLPNPEWVRPQHLCFFKHLDRVLCKTHDACEIMRAYHPDVRLMGFSNPLVDSMPKVSHDLGRLHRFLHVAGKNRKKGTLPIVEAWRRHPGWPTLDLVMDDVSALKPLPENVRLWKDPDDATLMTLRKEAGIVLAPSEVEGYGHILIEAMAFQEIVLTTDAAPMNELVDPSRGYLLPWERSEPCHLGERYFVAADAIEKAVTLILDTPQVDLLAKSAKARSWCFDNHQAFLRSLEQEINELRGVKLPRQSAVRSLIAEV